MRTAILCGAALLLTAGACSRAEQTNGAESVLWEVPDLPGPVTVEVSGQPVDPVLVHGYLLPLWTEHWSQRSAAGLDATAASFYDNPRSLFTPLVRGIVLLQEAESRWPQLSEVEVSMLRDDMAANTGEAFEALERRIGPAGMRAHVERELRKRRLLAEFAAEALEVTDDEVFARYEAMMAEVDEPGLLLDAGVNFATLEPQIRADLERARAIELQEAWIDEQMPLARVVCNLPELGAVSW